MKGVAFYKQPEARLRFCGELRGRRYSQQGLTLVELVISIVVVSFALTALLSSFSFSAARSGDPMWQTKATQLAQAYLDEIIAMRFQEDSPSGGGAVASCRVDGSEAGETSRELFDDVDDYHNLNEAARFLDNSVGVGYNNYQVSITVSCEDAAGGVSSNSKSIALTVTAANGSRLRFAALRGNF
ncbi:MAG: prepilin-type N-terminal cleavage/methylation domain-containing protein [Pseudomonadota bacterium]|jgi:MSHA pilin protein MshD